MNDDIDPLLGNALISLSGKKWHDMRATLSPSFTGSKMRHMLSLILNSTNTSIQTVKNQIASSSDNGVLEMKEFFSKFTIDIIASCAFGLEVDTFKHPENDFKKVADATMYPNGLKIAIKFFFLYFIPKIMKIFDISVLERKTKNFFRNTVNDTMAYREKNGIVRPDMIHLLMQTKKGKLTHDNTIENEKTESIAAVEESKVGKSKVSFEWTNDELVAQCLIFFLAGEFTMRKINLKE